MQNTEDRQCLYFDFSPQLHWKVSIRLGSCWNCC
jgi:hypothetical protein